MRPVGHALVSLAAISSVRLVLGLAVPSAGTFIGAIVSAVMDLDRRDEPPHNTPFVHSILMAGIWNIIGICFALAFRNMVDPFDLCLGLSVGLWGHLLFDHLLGETVYTCPRKATADERSEVIVLHDGGVAVLALWDRYSRISAGLDAWPRWGRCH